MNTQAKRHFEKCLETNHWGHFLEFLSPMERDILLVMRDHAMGAQAIAIRTLSPEASIGAVLSRMANDKVLALVAPGLYAIAHKELVEQVKKEAPLVLAREDVVHYVEQLAYDTFCPVFESLEHQQLISGNGHHMAQNLMNQLGEDLRKRWRRS